MLESDVSRLTSQLEALSKEKAMLLEQENAAQEVAQKAEKRAQQSERKAHEAEKSAQNAIERLEDGATRLKAAQKRITSIEEQLRLTTEKLAHMENQASVADTKEKAGENEEKAEKENVTGHTPSAWTDTDIVPSTPSLPKVGNLVRAVASDPTARATTPQSKSSIDVQSLLKEVTILRGQLTKRGQELENFRLAAKAKDERDADIILTLEAQQEQLEDARTKTEQRLRTMEKAQAEWEGKRKALELTISSLDEEKRELGARLAGVEKERAELQQTMTEAEERMKRGPQHIPLADVTRQLSDQAARYASLKEERDKLAQHIQSVTLERDELKRELDRSTEAAEHQQRQSMAIIDSLQEAKQQVETQLQETIEAQSAKDAERREWEMERTALRQELNSAGAALSSGGNLKQELSSFLRKYRALEKRLDAEIEQRNSMKEANSELRELLKQANNRCSKLDKENRDTAMRVQELQKQLQGIAAERDKSWADVIDQTTKDLRGAEHRIAGLEKELLDAREQLKQQAETLQAEFNSKLGLELKRQKQTERGLREHIQLLKKQLDYNSKGASEIWKLEDTKRRLERENRKLKGVIAAQSPSTSPGSSPSSPSAREAKEEQARLQRELASVRVQLQRTSEELDSVRAGGDSRVQELEQEVERVQQQRSKDRVPASPSEVKSHAGEASVLGDDEEKETKLLNELRSQRDEAVALYNGLRADVERNNTNSRREIDLLTHHYEGKIAALIEQHQQQSNAVTKQLVQVQERAKQLQERVGDMNHQQSVTNEETATLRSKEADNVATIQRLSGRLNDLTEEKNRLLEEMKELKQQIENDEVLRKETEAATRQAATATAELEAQNRMLRSKLEERNRLLEETDDSLTMKNVDAQLEQLSNEKERSRELQSQLATAEDALQDLRTQMQQLQLAHQQTLDNNVFLKSRLREQTSQCKFAEEEAQRQIVDLRATIAKLEAHGRDLTEQSQKVEDEAEARIAAARSDVDILQKRLLERVSSSPSSVSPPLSPAKEEELENLISTLRAENNVLKKETVQMSARPADDEQSNIVSRLELEKEELNHRLDRYQLTIHQLKEQLVEAGERYLAVDRERERIQLVLSHQFEGLMSKTGNMGADEEASSIAALQKQLRDLQREHDDLKLQTNK